jgi:hypothetical protein
MDPSMQKKRLICAVWLLLALPFYLFGAAGRPEDGFLSFIVVLGFLGMILGILYLVDFIRVQIRRFLEKNGDDLTP